MEFWKSASWVGDLFRLVGLHGGQQVLQGGISSGVKPLRLAYSSAVAETMSAGGAAEQGNTAGGGFGIEIVLIGFGGHEYIIHPVVFAQNVGSYIGVFERVR